MPSAFISYSWDDESHKEWVLELATRLRNDGITAVLDRWAVIPGDRLPVFMEKAIRESDYVLVICTPRYKEKADRRVGGVGYEENIISGEVLTTLDERKFIPVLRLGDVNATPTWMVGKYHIDLRGNPYDEASYRDLVATLHGTREQAPPVINIKAKRPPGGQDTVLVESPDVTAPGQDRKDEELLASPMETGHFETIRLEVHKVSRGYVQDEKEVVTFRGRQVYAGTDFRGLCEVYQKEDGKLLFYHLRYEKMVYTEYRDLNDASRALSSGYPVHDRSAIRGAAAALGVELDFDERQI